MRRYLAAGVLLLVWGSGYGAQWHAVQTAPEKAVYVDLAGRVRAGNAVQTWDWQKYAEEQKSAAGQSAFHWVKSLTRYDCLRRSTSPLLRIYFRNDGSEVRREHLEGLRFPAVIEPDSLDEKLLELACNPPGKPRKEAAENVKPKPAVAEPAGAGNTPAGAESAGNAPGTTEAKTGKVESTVKPVPKAEPLKAAAKPVKAAPKTTAQAPDRKPVPKRAAARLPVKKPGPVALAKLEKVKMKAALIKVPEVAAAAAEPLPGAADPSNGAPSTPQVHPNEAGGDWLFN